MISWYLYETERFKFCYIFYLLYYFKSLAFIYSINTGSSQNNTFRAPYFEGKTNKVFRLEFLYIKKNFLTQNFSQNFIVKYVLKYQCVKFDAFLSGYNSFILPQKMLLESKVLKSKFLIFPTLQISLLFISTFVYISS